MEFRVRTGVAPGSGGTYNILTGLPVITTESGETISVNQIEDGMGQKDAFGLKNGSYIFSYHQPEENVTITFPAQKTSTIHQAYSGINKAYTGEPVQLSTENGVDLAWFGDGRIVYFENSYWVDNSGMWWQTYNGDEGKAGTAPIEPGHYRVTASTSKTEEYAADSITVEFYITEGAGSFGTLRVEDSRENRSYLENPQITADKAFIVFASPSSNSSYGGSSVAPDKDGRLNVYLGNKQLHNAYFNTEWHDSKVYSWYSIWQNRDYFDLANGGTYTLTARYEGDSKISDCQETFTLTILPNSIESIGDAECSVEAFTYTGEEQGPSLSTGGSIGYWTCGSSPDGYDLQSGVDYTIGYQNAVNAYTLSENDPGFDPEAAPVLLMKGCGSFSGTKKFFYTIQKAESEILIPQTSIAKSVGDEDFSLGCTVSECGVPDSVLTYTVSDGKAENGSEKDASDILTVDESGMATILGSGSVTVTVNMPESENHLAAETKTITVQVAGVKGFWVQQMADQLYTGKAITPAPLVRDGNTGRLLTAGKDYTVTYQNNVKASTGITDAAKKPMILVKGKGNYSGTKTVSFDILPYTLSENAITADDLFTEQNGKVQKKAPVVSFDGKKLKEKTDYTVSFSTEPKENGVYDITLTGIGNFTGSKIVKLTIADKGMLLTKAAVNTVKAKPYQNGTPVTLSGNELVVTTKVSGKKVTLTEGTDYTVSYQNNTNAGKATVTVTGKGAYAGSKSVNFTITGTSFKKAKVAGLADKAYTGAAITQNLTVTIADKAVQGGVKTLTEGTDYTISYENNVKAGKATVVLSGTGAYTGSLKKKFKITAGTIEGAVITGFDVSGNSVSMDAVYAAYEKQGVKPAIELTVSGDLLTEGTDYTVTYKNNKAVTTADTKKLPTIFIKGCGNYAGKLTQTFLITAKELNNPADPVAMRAADKAASTKKGGYISVPIVNESSVQRLKAGKDFDAAYKKADGTVLTKNDTAVAGDVITVIVTGKGGYTGELTTTYRITERDFTKAKVAAITKTYNGETVVLVSGDFVKADGSSVITFKNGSTTEQLVYGTDFTIVPGSYVNNEKAGKATVTIKGVGCYGGEKVIRFVISEKKI